MYIFCKFHNYIGPTERTVIILKRKGFFSSEWLEKYDLDPVVILRYQNVMLHCCGKQN
jgi:hypothetical protein